MPVSGEVIEINTELKDNAGVVNSESYTKGWMIKVRLKDLSELNALLTSEGYQGLVG